MNVPHAAYRGTTCAHPSDQWHSTGSARCRSANDAGPKQDEGRTVRSMRAHVPPLSRICAKVSTSWHDGPIVKMTANRQVECLSRSQNQTNSSFHGETSKVRCAILCRKRVEEPPAQQQAGQKGRCGIQALPPIEHEHHMSTINVSH